ncbi:J domain-containing protein [Luteibacter aegosomatissinici]|uniref:J domain-containing protein n=1 Tax=Luteibacter aegosomatissinici TaxID=2911539 RepID=UPI001FFBBD2F|nr:J domain-containing protein [Luteibacter aegosomatissinici]UPG95021.1 J domain-containing protein [Luteibacter aegosomatissinici]
MTIPWFLAHLGLDASAGERDVRRAYALQLKAIDQAGDPAAFDRLRQAYEVARSFVAGGGAVGDIAPPEELPAPGTTPAPSPAAAPVATAAREETALVIGHRALDRFCARVHEGTDADIASELTACLTALRLQRADAATVFEAGLIERLAVGGMRQRAAIFRIALEQFGWNDVSHFRQLGAEGRWVETIERQRHELSKTWDGPRLLNTLEALARGAPLQAHVALWPAAREAMNHQRDFMALHLTAQQAGAWEQLHEQRALVTAGEKPPRGLAYWFQWIFLGLIALCLLSSFFH